jgi:hypothetical protein
MILLYFLQQSIIKYKSSVIFSRLNLLEDGIETKSSNKLECRNLIGIANNNLKLEKEIIRKE